MVKIIAVLILLAGCASKKPKTGLVLTVDMRNNLFRHQSYFEQMKELREPVFVALGEDKCLLAWEQEVFALKEKLKRSKENDDRVNIWYRLGNCYNYVGQYELSFYYYDLALPALNKRAVEKSTISYNIGRVYHARGNVVLAESYYQEAIQYNLKNNLALVNLALLYSEQGEFKRSNQKLDSILRNTPSSRLARFFQGLNYFHLKDYKSLESKVINRLADTSTEKALLSLARDIARERKGAYQDLKKEDFDFPWFKSFKNYLLNKFGKSANGKTKV